MKFTKISIAVIAFATLTACSNQATNEHSNMNHSNMNMSNANSAPAVQNLSEIPRPQKIADMMTQRGEQDEASPRLKILAPKANETVASSTVKVKLELGGDLKGYKPMKDMATGMGNHIHVILDNQPYEAYYNLDEEFELRNVADGEHTLRVFPSRPWHESYKTDGAFQMVKFTVKNGGADTNKPTVTNSGNTMANSNANTSATPEGKDMQSSTAGAVDAEKPLLTYSRPKGEYKGDDTNAIMIDFWLINAKLKDGGGDYRVRYAVDGGEAKYIDKWEPIWLSGWAAGKHKIKLELVDKNGNAVDNGGYNSTEREITVVK
ncbi:MAG TPA: hypothetical protein VGC97_21740 [Pyrinomonadaceae bacterium]|jgi:hypothetical protein